MNSEGGSAPLPNLPPRGEAAAKPRRGVEHPEVGAVSPPAGAVEVPSGASPHRWERGERRREAAARSCHGQGASRMHETALPAQRFLGSGTLLVAEHLVVSGEA